MYPWGAPAQQWGYYQDPAMYQVSQAPIMPTYPAVDAYPQPDAYPVADAALLDDDNDPRKQKSPKLAIQGSAETMNLPPQLLVAIQSSDYFKKLYNLKAYPQVINEISSEVTHVEPWDANMAASPAFCLMFKLFRMRLTERQMEGLTENQNSVYARAIGLLYLRLSAKNEVLWDWLSPYFYDEEEITLGRHETKKTFAKHLLFEQKHFTLLLPRIPVPFMKKLTEQLAQLEAESGVIDKLESEKPVRGGERDSERKGNKQRDNRDSRVKDDRERGGREGDRYRDRERERDRDDRDKEGQRDKERDRDDRDRNRDRERRDRDDRHRDDRHRDDRHRDREYRSRDGDRDRDRDRHRHRDDRDRDRRDKDDRYRRDSRRERSRSRDSPSRKKARTEPTSPPTTFTRSRGVPVDMKQLRDTYGDASGKSTDSSYNVNPNLGATETMRIGF